MLVLDRQVRLVMSCSSRNVETNDVLTAANVPDAKMLRERVEWVISQRKTDAGSEAIAERADAKRMHDEWEKVNSLLRGAGHNTFEGLFGWGDLPRLVRSLLDAMPSDSEKAVEEQLRDVWQKLRDITGIVSITDADLDAVTEEDAANGPDARRYYAERKAIVRVIRERVDELNAMHLKMQLRGFRVDNGVDGDKRMLHAVERLLAVHDAFQRVRAAFSRVDAVAANRPEEEFASFVEQHLTSTSEHRFASNGWAKAMKDLQAIGDAFVQMRRKVWDSFAKLRRTTDYRPSLMTPEHAPCTALLDVFNVLGEWHAKTDRELCDLADDVPNIVERRANLTGRAHSYVHAMDLIVALGRDGYEIVKPQ